jgi:Holliday junction resolvase RusA-like endonuclease
MIEFVVIGSPGPQGSKRHVGGGVMIESSAKVKPWREAVVWACREAMRHSGRVDGPVIADMVFTLAKPKSAPKRRRTFPDRKPDISKLIRSTEDALTTAGAYEDDARIVKYGELEKVFPGEHPRSLDVPGAWIRIRQLEDGL